MASIQLIRTSSSSGPAALATVQAQRSAASMTFSVDTVSNFPTAGFIATSGTPTNVALATGNNLTVLTNPLVFKGHVNNSNIVIDEVADGYTDNGSNIGDVIIVKPTSAWGNEIADILEVSLNDDGTLNSSTINNIKDEVLNTGLTANNLRYKPRMYSAQTTSSLTPNIDNYNFYRIWGQAGNITINNPTGTPNSGDGLLMEIQDNGTSRSITWGSDYIAESVYGLSLPTSTTPNKTLFITFVYRYGAGWVAVL